MTTLTAAPLTDLQQALIDSRLDTIDRVLLGRVPRSDRVAIVREVESQIHELLAERDSTEISRDDVIEVLRRLDPPEAYLPDEGDDENHTHTQRPVKTFKTLKSSAENSGWNVGKIGGIMGLGSFGLTLVSILLYVLAQGQTATPFLIIVLDTIPSLGFFSSIAALVLSILGRRQGTWPVIGMVFGIIALQVWVVKVSWMFLLMHMA